MEKENESNNLNTIWIFVGFILILVSILFFIQSFSYMSTSKYGNDMDKTFVGGAAYNYIIAGTYSTTIMLRALFFALLGGFSLLMSKK